ncbi:TlpA family protein disulfide reductase [Novipirellula artificiosorum]|uniref:Thiol-disulfide oxidoreductase ResA n=1 Tax=Novipirellula artificiosorum TaxID=2528016 RepID=A0A5C6CW19_9BACT|nr:TlpA disulfide reductase family protein [Novipirellula artificiosorum]TWU28772.1 Thiol-disulfide oxidoreductase ResA [Novipirellula artificiosorum]
MIYFSLAVALLIGMILGPIFVVALLLLLSSRSGKGRGDSKLDPPEIPGKIVSLDFTVRTLDDQEVNLEALREGRPMFLNFWATWCGPCVKEMSSIETLYKQSDGRLAFACVSKEETEVLKEFLDKHSYSFPVYRIEETPSDFETRGIPATFVLSSLREVALQHVGAADWADPSVLDFVERLASRDQ